MSSFCALVLAVACTSVACGLQGVQLVRHEQAIASDGSFDRKDPNFFQASVKKTTCLPKETKKWMDKFYAARSPNHVTAADCESRCQSTDGGWCVHSEVSTADGGSCMLYDCTPEAACTSDVDCAASETCDTASGKCEAPAQAACTSEDDCTAAETCDTATGKCVGIPIQATCSSTDPCTAPEVCDTTTGTCEAAAQAAQAAQACVDDEEKMKNWPKNTCAQQKDADNCGKQWFKELGVCNKTCGDCPESGTYTERRSGVCAGLGTCTQTACEESSECCNKQKDWENRVRDIKSEVNSCKQNPGTEACTNYDCSNELVTVYKASLLFTTCGNSQASSGKVACMACFGCTSGELSFCPEFIASSHCTPFAATMLENSNNSNYRTNLQQRSGAGAALVANSRRASLDTTLGDKCAAR